MRIWKFFRRYTTECIVVFAFGIVLIFSMVVMAMSTRGIMISDTLIEWFYKFFGLELLALSGIKISKHVGSAFGKVEEVVDGVVVDEFVGDPVEPEETEDVG